MDEARPLTLAGQTAKIGDVFPSETTGLYWLVRRVTEAEAYTSSVVEAVEFVCPVKQGAVLMDEENRRVLVTDSGELRVAEYSGLPFMGTDAAGADTYVTILTTGGRCRNLMVRCGTQNAILSLDGGVTEHIYVVAGNVQTFYGLDIPAGVNIQAKNATVASNYISLYLMVW